MKLRISREEMAARKLFIATPMYGGMCTGDYMTSVLHLTTAMTKAGIHWDYRAIMGESLVPKARDNLVALFLRSGCTHLLFVDADIEFSADDAVSLLVLAGPKSDKDVICGLYPKKRVRWENIAAAAQRGIPYQLLPKMGGDYVFNPGGDTGTYDIEQLHEVQEAGTGFMCIQRKVFINFWNEYPDRRYKDDDKQTQRCMYFSEGIEEGTGRRLPEDYNFCRLVRAAGMKIWAAPWLKLNHLGQYKYPGDIGMLSAQPVTEAA